MDVLNVSGKLGTLATIKSEKPHLLIVDISCPALNWLKLVETIKADPENSHLHVIAVSGEFGDDIRADISKLGVDDFITKQEISSETYSARVRRLIG